MTSVLYDKIVKDLLGQRAELNEPMRLPVEAEMASQFSVGRDTIRRALNVLEKQGAVTRHRRRGTYLYPERSNVQGLRGRKVGFVPPWWAGGTTTWLTASMFEGVSRWADEHECDICVLHADARPTDFVSWEACLRDRKIDGIVWFHPQPQQMELVQDLSAHVPSVVAGCQYPGMGLHHVMPDYDQAAQLIDNRLVGLGHDKYALVGTRMLESYGQTWRQAVTRAHAHRGSEFDYNYHLLDINAFGRENLAQLLLQFYEPLHTEISAYVLISSSYLLSLIANQDFCDRIGRDISVVTIDFSSQPVESYWPGHAIEHIACDWPGVGRKALEMLDHLVGGHVVPEVVRHPVELVKGESCCPPAAEKRAGSMPGVRENSVVQS